MTPTFLVEDVRYNSFLTAQIQFSKNDNLIGGRKIQNTNLMLSWQQERALDIQPISSFDISNYSGQNSYYLIQINYNEEMLNSNIWDAIPVASRNIINQLKLPIVMYYPFEYLCPQNISDRQSPLDEYVKRFREFFPKTKLIHWSMLVFRNSAGHLINVAEATGNTNYKDVEFAPTVAFADHTYYVNQNICNNGHDLGIHRYPKVRDKLFLCLNNCPRPSRILLCQALHASKLLSKGIVSMNFEYSDRANGVAFMNDSLISDSPTMQSSTSYLKELFFRDIINSAEDNKFSKQILDIGNDSFNDTYDPNWYLDTWCSIITETHSMTWVNFSAESPCLTEKTVKAILNMHPFVIFGAGGSHKFLQELGFRTFEQSFFELPEDGVIGNITLGDRLYNLIESLERLAALSQEEMYQKWERVVPDLIHNKTLLRENNWGKKQLEYIVNAATH